MARLSTTVRDQDGNELFRMEGRQPRGTILQAARLQAERHARALQYEGQWTVTTQRGSIPALGYEEVADGA